jgi:hypothetical protein
MHKNHRAQPFTTTLLLSGTLLLAACGTGGAGNGATSSPKQLVRQAAVPAAVLRPPVDTEAITIFPERDFVTLDGFLPNKALVIEAYRPTMTPAGGWKLIGQSTGVTDATGFLEVNHPGGSCWLASPTGAAVVGTPDLLPGDVIIVAWDTDGTPETLEAQRESAVRNIYTNAPYVIRNANGTSNVEVTGQAFPPAGVDNATFLGELEQRFVNPNRFSNGRRNVGAVVGNTGEGLDGVLEWADEAQHIWRARWNNLPQTDVDALLASETRVMWVSPVNVNNLSNELTIFEKPGTPGPFQFSCAAFALNAATSLVVTAGGLSPSTPAEDGLRIGLAGAGAANPISLSGLTQGDISQVAVLFPGVAAPAIAQSAVPCGPTTTWSLPNAIGTNSLGALADGIYEIVTRFTVGAEVFHGAPIRLTVDKTPPTIVVSPPVTVNGRSFVTLTSPNDRDATFRFGTAGTVTTDYTAPIDVTGVTTLTVRATDKAGNPTTQSFPLAGTGGTPADVTPPTVTATPFAPAPGVARLPRSPATVTLVADDPQATITVNADDGSGGAPELTATGVGRATITVSAPRSGRAPLWTLTWTAKDAAGNISTPQSGQYRF